MLKGTCIAIFVIYIAVANCDMFIPYVIFKCDGGLLEELPSQYNETVDAVTVHIGDCSLSHSTYVEEIKRLNVTFDKLILQYNKNLTQGLTPYNAKFFKNLDILELSIVNEIHDPRIKNLSTEFIKDIVNLKTFLTINVDVPLLPSSTLEKITLSHGKSIGEFGDCSNMQELMLIEWDLNLANDRWLANCSKLKILKLNTMNLTSIIIRRVLEDVSSLRELNINNCGLQDFPTEVSKYAVNVNTIDLGWNEFRTLSLDHIKMKSLKYVSLYFTKTDHLELKGVPVTEVNELSLDFHYNNVTNWRLQNSDFETLRNVPVLAYFQDLELNCNCNNGMFLRAIRESRLKLLLPNIPYYGVYPSVHCSDGTRFENITRDAVECDRFDCSNCTCQRQWSDNSTVARCGGIATRVPRVRGLRALHAAGNRIETLSAEDLPDTLLMLDLSGNRLSSIDKNTTTALFNVKERQILLENNSFSCKCENLFLFEILQSNQSQVEDYNQLWCIDGDIKIALRDITLSDLCRDPYIGLYIAIAILLGLAVITGILYYYYKENFQACLYARRYCMWCIHKKEVDIDRRYDAFLSFSQSDEEFVKGQLVPGLNNEYKLCLYDFVSGNITRSTKESRRTVIVLSKNFLQSVWGIQEFRIPHTSVLKEGRMRVIFITLEDIMDKDLDPELHSYVKTSKNIRWGDKWFWEKLRYAMPHREFTSVAPVTIQPAVNHGAVHSDTAPLGSSIELQETQLPATELGYDNLGLSEE